MKSYNVIHRKGFFFTLDALIALGVLVTGFLLVLGFHTFRPIETQSILFAEDFLEVFASTKVSDTDSDIIFKMWCSECNGSHIISRIDNTLMEQMAEFIYRSNDTNNFIDDAEIIAKEIGAGLINEQFNYEFSITGDEQHVLLSHGNKDFEASNLLLSSKRLVYGIYENQLIGPFVAEVRIWQ